MIVIGDDGVPGLTSPAGPSGHFVQKHDVGKIIVATYLYHLHPLAAHLYSLIHYPVIETLTKIQDGMCMLDCAISKLGHSSSHAQLKRLFNMAEFVSKTPLLPQHLNSLPRCSIPSSISAM